MSRSVQKRIALIVALAGGLSVAATTGLLIADVIVARSRLPADEARVEDLLEQGQTDAAFAPVLHAEFERQTATSLQREARQGTLSTVLVMAAVIFLTSTKWLLALRGYPIHLPKKLHTPPAPTTGTSEPETPARDPLHPEHPTAAVLADVDLSFVDEIVAREGRGPAALIPILQALQSHYRYLPQAALRRICQRTEISPAQLTGVATFYTQFRRTPVGKHVVRVCHGTACHVAGAPRITDELRRYLQIAPGEDTDAARDFTVEQVACLGCCTLAPVVQLDETVHGHLQPDTALELLSRADESSVDDISRTHASTVSAAPDAPIAEIRIGLGSCCVASGSERVYDALQKSLVITGVKAVVKRVGCVGMCHQTPLIEIDPQTPGRPSARYARVLPEHARRIVHRHFKPNGMARRLRHTVAAVLDEFRDRAAREITAKHAFELRDPPVAAFLGPQRHIATEHCGQLDPTNLDEYLRHDGFRALQRCLRDFTPNEVIEQIRLSGLRGRGGAGFPTAEKWSKVRQALDVSPKGHGCVVCNGDEGDPGAFMDRMLMESYPYRIIEGVAIAVYATGASEAVFYIRHEYSLAAARIRDALRQCQERGLLCGELAFRARIVEGGGAFVCGEETALIASLEGRRGMPNLRPPYPAESGLGGRPTLVGNVETFAVVPWILRNGADRFAELGTPTSKGTKVFALAGKIKRGGLIEVPMGVTIREIVETIGGGINDEARPFGNRSHTFKAVQIGGPSGGCVPAELADTPVDYEALVDVGAMMGSGGLVVLDETDCMVDIARYFLTFTQSQSCGQCTPCRVGTRRLLDILERLCNGEGRRGDLEKLEHLARMVSQGSLCALGRTAPNPVLTTLRYFRDEYEAHLEGRCPAGKCKALITYSITDDCTGCTLCAQHCPAGAIEMQPYEKHEIDADKCTRCDTCRTKCPEDAIEIM